MEVIFLYIFGLVCMVLSENLKFGKTAGNLILPTGSVFKNEIISNADVSVPSSNAFITSENVTNSFDRKRKIDEKPTTIAHNTSKLINTSNILNVPFQNTKSSKYFNTLESIEFCSNVRTLTFPNVYDCNSYYRCATGEIIPTFCPENTVWDCIKKTCTDAMYKPCCPKDPRPHNYTEVCSHYHKEPNPVNCSSYLHCGKKLETGNCDKGQSFDVIKRECVEESKALCILQNTPRDEDKKTIEFNNEKIKNEVRNMLRKDLEDKLNKEIKKKLNEETVKIKMEIRNKLNKETRNKISKEIKNKLNKNIKEKFNKEVKDKLNKGVSGKLNQEIKEKLNVTVNEKLNSEAHEQLNEELIENLNKVVKEKLNEEMKEILNKQLNRKLKKGKLKKKINEKSNKVEVAKSKDDEDKSNRKRIYNEKKSDDETSSKQKSKKTKDEETIQDAKHNEEMKNDSKETKTNKPDGNKFVNYMPKYLDEKRKLNKMKTEKSLKKFENNKFQEKPHKKKTNKGKHKAKIYAEKNDSKRKSDRKKHNEERFNNDLKEFNERRLNKAATAEEKGKRSGGIKSFEKKFQAKTNEIKSIDEEQDIANEDARRHDRGKSKKRHEINGDKTVGKNNIDDEENNGIVNQDKENVTFDRPGENERKKSSEIKRQKRFERSKTKTDREEKNQGTTEETVEKSTKPYVEEEKDDDDNEDENDEDKNGKETKSIKKKTKSEDENVTNKKTIGKHNDKTYYRDKLHTDLTKSYENEYNGEEFDEESNNKQTKSLDGNENFDERKFSSDDNEYVVKIDRGKMRKYVLKFPKPKTIKEKPEGTKSMLNTTNEKPNVAKMKHEETSKGNVRNVNDRSEDKNVFEENVRNRNDDRNFHGEIIITYEEKPDEKSVAEIYYEKIHRRKQNKDKFHHEIKISFENKNDESDEQKGMHYRKHDQFYKDSYEEADSREDRYYEDRSDDDSREDRFQEDDNYRGRYRENRFFKERSDDDLREDFQADRSREEDSYEAFSREKQKHSRPKHLHDSRSEEKQLVESNEDETKTNKDTYRTRSSGKGQTRGLNKHRDKGGSDEDQKSFDELSNEGKSKPEVFSDRNNNSIDENEKESKNESKRRKIESDGNSKGNPRDDKELNGVEEKEQELPREGIAEKEKLITKAREATPKPREEVTEYNTTEIIRPVEVVTKSHEEAEIKTREPDESNGKVDGVTEVVKGAAVRDESKNSNELFSSFHETETKHETQHINENSSKINEIQSKLEMLSKLNEVSFDPNDELSQFNEAKNYVKAKYEMSRTSLPSKIEVNSKESPKVIPKSRKADRRAKRALSNGMDPLSKFDEELSKFHDVVLKSQGKNSQYGQIILPNPQENQQKLKDIANSDVAIPKFLEKLTNLEEKIRSRKPKTKHHDKSSSLHDKIIKPTEDENDFFKRINPEDNTSEDKMSDQNEILAPKDEVSNAHRILVSINDMSDSQNSLSDSRDGYKNRDDSQEVAQYEYLRNRKSNFHDKKSNPRGKYRIIDSQNTQSESLDTLPDGRDRMSDAHGRAPKYHGRKPSFHRRTSKPYGIISNIQEKSMDSRGSIIDTQGILIDSEGRIIDSHGIIINPRDKILGSEGKIVKYRGRANSDDRMPQRRVNLYDPNYKDRTLNDRDRMTESRELTDRDIPQKKRSERYEILKSAETASEEIVPDDPNEPFDRHIVRSLKLKYPDETAEFDYMKSYDRQHYPSKRGKRKLQLKKCAVATKINNVRNCHKYFKCVDGNVIPQRCPGDLFYNCWTNQCGKKGYINCCKSHLPFEEQCSGTYLIPDPRKCSGYYTCWNNTKLIHNNCKIGTMFDVWSNTCKENDVAICALDLAVKKMY